MHIHCASGANAQVTFMVAIITKTCAQIIK